MATTPKLTIDITPKVVKVTAEVELHVDGRCVGTTTVDLTPVDEADSKADPAPLIFNVGVKAPDRPAVNRSMYEQTLGR